VKTWIQNVRITDAETLFQIYAADTSDINSVSAQTIDTNNDCKEGAQCTRDLENSFNIVAQDRDVNSNISKLVRQTMIAKEKELHVLPLPQIQSITLVEVVHLYLQHNRLQPPMPLKKQKLESIMLNRVLVKKMNVVVKVRPAVRQQIIL
jgi:hypothetical protein